jgi:hypothetical protein
MHTKDEYYWGQTTIKELSVFHLTADSNRAIGFPWSSENIDQGMTNKEF